MNSSDIEYLSLIVTRAKTEGAIILSGGNAEAFARVLGAVVEEIQDRRSVAARCAEIAERISREFLLSGMDGWKAYGADTTAAGIKKEFGL